MDIQSSNKTGDPSNEKARRRASERELLLTYLTAGLSFAEAGEMVGISSPTVRRHNSQPEFRAALAKRRGHLESEAAGRAAALEPLAWDVIAATMSGPDPALALKAALAVGPASARLRVVVDQAARLSQLEALLAGLLEEQRHGR